MGRCVYTVLTNNYDTLRMPIARPAGYEFICFTDNPNLQVSGWQMRYVQPSDNPVKQQREIKIRPHVFLPEFKFTIYHDASTQLKRDISYIIRNHFRGGSMFKLHPTRRCVYTEGATCIELGKDSAESINRQLDIYRADGMPANFGMYETGIIFRENRADVNAMCDAWWDQVKQYSHRDQVSLPYVLWKSGYRPGEIAYNVLSSFITIFKHANWQPKPAQQKSVRIHYSNPWSSDKNIGRAYNEFCARVPENDWICLQDGDVMYLTDFWGKQIEDIIKLNPQYALIGCYTNRLASPHQCYNGEFSENTDLIHHMEIAERLYKDHYADVEHIHKGIAGMFMLFPKKTWLKHRFRENTNAFDSFFSKEVLKAGGKIGLAKGLYVLHRYRLGKENPTTNIEHLLNK